MNAKAKPLNRWLDISSRSAAAVLGGYAFTYVLTAALARLLPLARLDAVIVASLLSFLFYSVAILWAFAASSHRRAWVWLLALGAPLALIGFWPQLLERLQ